MDQKTKTNKRPKFKFSLYWMYALVIIFLAGTYLLDNNSMTKEVSYSDFEKYVATGGVEKITIYSNDAEAIAQVNDSLASTIFNKEQIQKGTEYRITTQIPSADKIQEKTVRSPFWPPVCSHKVRSLSITVRISQIFPQLWKSSPISVAHPVVRGPA